MRRRSPPLRPLDPRALTTSSLARRKSLVSVRDFATPPPAGAEIAALLSSLPDLLAGRALKRLIDRVVTAHRRKRRVAMAVGGHVIKCGLGPLLIALVEHGVLGSVAFNGGAAIHDLEIGLVGRTSEDVARALGDGSFGAARETAALLGDAAVAGAAGPGLGRALGDALCAAGGRHVRHSLLAACARAGVPATVHVALGADVAHMHALSGAAIGEASMIDFRLLAAVVAQLEGGVWMNVGSAVVLPEVFLKALAMARNLGHRVRRFTTVNLDMVQHYRPRNNVLERPAGEAIALTGHHEILLPLIYAGVLSRLHGHAIR